MIKKNIDKLAKVEQRLWRDTLHKTTKYDLGGASKYTIFKKVISLEKVEASKVLNELGYLEKMLDKADDPFVEASWLDVAESWKAMAKLIPEMHSERCQGVLQCIFSDDGVRKGLGAAEQFTGIDGSPPRGLLKLLKQGPGKHMKENAYRYKKQIAAEIAHIERIKNLQTQATAYAVSGIIVLGSTVGPFVASMFYNYMSCGKWFGQCDSD